MNVVTIAIGDLFDFEGRTLPAVRPDDETITAMVKRQFSFLPQPLQIEIGDKSVTVSFAAESPTAQQESTRLADGRVYASLEDQRSHLFTLTN